MYKSFDFEKTKTFVPKRLKGQISVVLADGDQKIEMSTLVIFH